MNSDYKLLETDEPDFAIEMFPLKKDEEEKDSLPTIFDLMDIEKKPLQSVFFGRMEELFSFLDKAEKINHEKLIKLAKQRQYPHIELLLSAFRQQTLEEKKDEDEDREKIEELNYFHLLLSCILYKKLNLFHRLLSLDHYKKLTESQVTELYWTAIYFKLYDVFSIMAEKPQLWPTPKSILFSFIHWVPPAIRNQLFEMQDKSQWVETKALIHLNTDSNSKSLVLPKEVETYITEHADFKEELQKQKKYDPWMLNPGEYGIEAINEKVKSGNYSLVMIAFAKTKHERNTELSDHDFFNYLYDKIKHYALSTIHLNDFSALMQWLDGLFGSPLTGITEFFEDPQLQTKTEALYFCLSLYGAKQCSLIPQQWLVQCAMKGDMLNLAAFRMFDYLSEERGKFTNERDEIKIPNNISYSILKKQKDWIQNEQKKLKNYLFKFVPQGQLDDIFKIIIPPEIDNSVTNEISDGTLPSLLPVDLFRLVISYLNMEKDFPLRLTLYKIFPVLNQAPSIKNLYVENVAQDLSNLYQIVNGLQDLYNASNTWKAWFLRNITPIVTLSNLLVLPAPLIWKIFSLAKTRDQLMSSNGWLNCTSQGYNMEAPNSGLLNYLCIPPNNVTAVSPYCDDLCHQITQVIGLFGLSIIGEVGLNLFSACVMPYCVKGLVRRYCGKSGNDDNMISLDLQSQIQKYKQCQEEKKELKNSYAKSLQEIEKLLEYFKLRLTEKEAQLKTQNESKNDNDAEEYVLEKQSIYINTRYRVVGNQSQHNSLRESLPNNKITPTATPTLGKTLG